MEREKKKETDRQRKSERVRGDRNREGGRKGERERTKICFLLFKLTL